MDIIDVAQEVSEDNVKDILSRIKSAINRPGVIDGFCQDCDCLIPTKRLLAAPWARRCVACQEEYEKEGKQAEG